MTKEVDDHLKAEISNIVRCHPFPILACPYLFGLVLVRNRLEPMNIQYVLASQPI